MIIIGVDPGTICTGYGIISFEKNKMLRIGQGVIVPKAYAQLPDRLAAIYDELNKILKLHKPDEFSIETAFYGKNIQSALKIGSARGVIMVAAVHNGIPITEYSPREVKKSVVGSGAATKAQVQYMISSILNVKEKFSRFDESDALAIAVCHAFKLKNPANRAGKITDWGAFVKANPERVLD